MTNCDAMVVVNTNHFSRVLGKASLDKSICGTFHHSHHDKSITFNGRRSYPSILAIVLRVSLRTRALGQSSSMWDTLNDGFRGVGLTGFDSLIPLTWWRMSFVRGYPVLLLLLLTIDDWPSIASSFTTRCCILSRSVCMAFY